MTIIYSFIQELLIENIMQCAKKWEPLSNGSESSKSTIMHLQDKKQNTNSVNTIFLIL